MNNTFEEFSNALKSKFCEFQSSTFSISFVISAIFVNHKYLMIYYSDIDPYIKLHMLEYQGINLWLPIVLALLYVYLYPYFAKRFYSKTLEFSNEFKETKIDKLKKRILDEDDAKNFVFEIEKLNKQLDEKTQFVSKMEGKYQEKQRKLFESHTKEIAKNQVDFTNIESELKSQISKLTSTIETMDSTVSSLESKIQRIEQESEKLKLENQKYQQETSRSNSEKGALFEIMKDIDGFQKLSTDKKIEKLLLANIAYYQIDDLLKLEKGYTQRIRPSMKLPSRSITTDEMILREINRLSEADIPSLLQKFHDLDENSLTVKMQKLRQEGKITIISNTQHYCLTEIGKRILN
jgi:hypothetical protein